MNRHEAKGLIGKDVQIDEGSNGIYMGVLEEITAKSNTPWSGKVRISGVLSLPRLEESDLSAGINLLYKSNERITVSGKKISSLNQAPDEGFDSSLIKALKEKWHFIQSQNDHYEKALIMIQQELKKLNAEHVVLQDAYVYYQLVKKGRELYIYDENKRESLSLEGCPFEFEIEVDEEWKTAYYISGFTFETIKGKRVELSHGSTVRLNKAQFDPYKILMNELDEPSLHALERGLEKFSISHEHCVYCHNSLLIQLLSSFKQSSFSGVNFISYADETKQFIVQHHYERTVREDEPDKTFDRFEFTSDKGERVLTTYATEFSKD